MTLQGAAIDVSDEATALAALEKAFDFRGDVTITLASGQTLSGYIFDRRRGSTLHDSYARLIGGSSEEKIRVAYSDVRRIEFGKDAAHGKSFDTWIKKYVEKKMKGEQAGIESEPLE
ncbi:MAG: hypothetical protein AB7O77_07590 [Phycisphaerales bacterium]